MDVSARTRRDTRGRPRGPGRLSASQAANLSDRLLDAAFGLFSTDGYARTTMERIARKAGASTKTLYSRYDNKGEVLAAVIERVITRSLATHVAETAVDPANIEPRRFLASFGREIVHRATGEGLGLNRIVCSEGHRYPELGKFMVQEIEPGVSRIQEALVTWRAEGLLPNLHDQRMSAVLLFTMMVDRARLRAVAGAPYSRKELDAHVDAAVDLFLRACGYAPALTADRAERAAADQERSPT